jgi:hypothetical protein
VWWKIADVSEILTVASNEGVHVMITNLHADTLTEKLVNTVSNKAAAYSRNPQ